LVIEAPGEAQAVGPRTVGGCFRGGDWERRVRAAAPILEVVNVTLASLVGAKLTFTAHHAVFVSLATLAGASVTFTTRGHAVPGIAVNVKLAAPPPATFTSTAPHAVDVRLAPSTEPSFTLTGGEG
jgi:hypothetical protein